MNIRGISCSTSFSLSVRWHVTPHAVFCCFMLELMMTCFHTCCLENPCLISSFVCSFVLVVFRLKSSLRLLQRFSRTLQLCFVLKLQKCFVDSWTFHRHGTYPLTVSSRQPNQSVSLRWRNILLWLFCTLKHLMSFISWLLFFSWTLCWSTLRWILAWNSIFWQKVSWLRSH